MADPILPADGQVRFLLGLVGPAVSAGVGITMRLAQGLIEGSRWSWRRLLLEIPSVAGIAIASQGAAEWLHLSAATASGFAALAGYLGPKVVVSVVVDRFGRKAAE